MSFYRNPQEQEQAEYEFGCATELQNMHALERMETRIERADAEVARLTALGFYVVVSEFEVCGRWTDALLGYASSVMLVTRSYDQALDYCGGYERQSRDGYVAHPEPPEWLGDPAQTRAAQARRR